VFGVLPRVGQEQFGDCHVVVVAVVVDMIAVAVDMIAVDMIAVDMIAVDTIAVDTIAVDKIDVSVICVILIFHSRRTAIGAFSTKHEIGMKGAFLPRDHFHLIGRSIVGGIAIAAINIDILAKFTEIHVGGRVHIDEFRHVQVIVLFLLVVTVITSW
jgi:hypothetical protein